MCAKGSIICAIYGNNFDIQWTSWQFCNGIFVFEEISKSYCIMKVLKVPIPTSAAYGITPCIDFCERILHCNKNDLDSQSIQCRRIHFSIPEI